ncbi:uncharacterized protein [Venturia canescens]|uniref:uncharacterized protein n=1 Tax=Venturia canescens TaxID=32260 RepID=UPI001C9CEAB4|nr:uncharacterized protein LOC122416847 [Venturia canescens]
MFYRVSRIILCLSIIFNISCSNIVETLLNKENDKLGDTAAMQMCIDSFDIYKNKIIRTQDSQGLGAKYLNEVDLGSREDCLRLCCETDECDVFIFEEKKPGSCYLFHCGRPHDFKCKFTSHANYSSAVLMNINYRGTAQLEEQIRRTQQEHELKSLRKLSEPAPLEYAYTEAPAIPVTQPPKSIVPTTPAPIKTGCSRNQYECRSSGDCIAIYNVCDGIPQCGDGSDEASDLGCPTEKPTLPSAPIIHEALIPHNPQILNKYPPNLPHRKNYPPIYTNERDNPPKLWQASNLPHQIDPQQQTNVQYPGPQGIMTIPQINYGPQGYIGGWDYRQMYEQNKENLNLPNQPHPLNELPRYEQNQPHIFKHKSPGVVVENAGPEGNTYIDTNRAYGSYYPLQNHGPWREGQPQIPLVQTEAAVTIAPKSQKNPPAIIKEEPKTTVGPEPCKPSSKQESDESKKISKVPESKEQETEKAKPIEKPKNQEHISKPENHEQGSKTITKVEKPRDHENRKKIHEEHKTEVRSHHFVAEHLQQNNHKFDNDVLRPKGAVISLALGLTATAIMAALIACRLRVVRKRGRRGHGPYAHDADYLVNGMYL